MSLCRRPTVFVMSPYAGDVEANLAYARACLRDCLRRGEAPFAPHLIYTLPGVLADDVAAERQLGIDCGMAWAKRADILAAYCDRGISTGMAQEIERLEAAERIVQRRRLKDGPAKAAQGPQLSDMTRRPV